MEVEDCGVLKQGQKDKEHAGNHPGCDGGHALHIWGHVGDGVENVGQHEEEGDQEGHPTGNNLGRDEEAHPRHNHKQSRRQVVDVEVPASIRKFSGVALMQGALEIPENGLNL